MINYFPIYDILSCAQHVEAKKLANKLWLRWYTLSDKDKVDKADAVKQEFNNLLTCFWRCGCYNK